MRKGGRGACSRHLVSLGPSSQYQLSYILKSQECALADISVEGGGV